MYEEGNLQGTIQTWEETLSNLPVFVLWDVKPSTHNYNYFYRRRRTLMSSNLPFKYSLGTVMGFHFYVFISPAAGPERRSWQSRRRCHHPRPPQTAAGLLSTLWSDDTFPQSNTNSIYTQLQLRRSFSHFSPGPRWSACTGLCSRWVQEALSSPCS